jgi:sugar O-acyltransferase (sialic acid O-acetyltransferase NeuD family)
MRKEIAIYGAGGLGRETLSLLKALPEWNVIGFFDDGLEKGTAVNTLPVLGNLQDLVHYASALRIVLAVGDPLIKSRLANTLKGNPRLEYPVLIHPNAILQDKESITLGQGSVITAGVVLTTGIRVDDYVLLNLNTTVGHDVRIGTCSSVMPGVNIAGGVTIGANVLIGSGAGVLNGVTIGDNARVGSGAVVTRSVEKDQTVVGVPASSIPKKQ